MRAAVYHGPGDVRVEQVPDVAEPGPGEVVLDVIRAAICGTDATEFSAKGPKMVPLHHRHDASGHEGPVVLGHEFVGRIKAIGDGPTDLQIGERVVPGAGAWCGSCERCREGRTNLCLHRYLIGIHKDGGLADSVAVPTVMCHRVPDSCTNDAAAMAQPLAIALHGLSRSQVQNASVAVIGAGGIGSFLIAVAKRQGVASLTAIDVSDKRLERARSLGADHTFKADSPHLREALRDLTGGYGPDVVIEASGAPPTPALAASLVRAGGRLTLMGMQSAPRELDLFTMAQWEVDVVTANAHVCDRDLPDAIDVLDDSDFAERVMDRRIPLERLVEDGLVPLVEASADGKIVIDPTA